MLIKYLTVNHLDKTKQNSFTLLKRTSSYYSVGSHFQFIEYGTDKPLKKATLIYKETFRFDSLQDYHAYITKDCDVDTVKLILKNYGMSSLDMVDYLLFSSWAYDTRTNIGHGVVDDLRNKEIYKNIIHD